MAIRRGERAEYLTLFDGFSFVGKVIGLNIVMGFFIVLWAMLFVIPGIIAMYRYRFALYNLFENPGIGVMEALDMSKRQTQGYKSQLFMLDLSYIGWGILASIPAIIYSSIATQQMLQNGLMDYAGAGIGSGAIAGTISATISAASFDVSPVLNALSLSDWIWTLVIGLWSLVVSLFYLPDYQCVELGYFEIAKSTSGIGEGAGPRQEDTWRGPDNLGGF
jgi:hypothetical protein